MSTNYPDTKLFLDGEWRDALAKENLEIINPATEEVIGKVSHARKEDLDIALTAERKLLIVGKMFQHTSAQKFFVKRLTSLEVMLMKLQL